MDDFIFFSNKIKIFNTDIYIVTFMNCYYIIYFKIIVLSLLIENFCQYITVHGCYHLLQPALSGLARTQVAQVVEHLPRQHEALHSNPSTSTRKQNKINCAI
jgi:hypothetical protein